jgi:PLP dependent protein
MSVSRNIADVLQRVASACARSGRDGGSVRVVAVSKTKPSDAVKACYDAGHRSFGENYVQELIDKAPTLPDDVRWHFVGHLQSNKAKALLEGVPSLAMLETIDSEKLANKVNNAVPERRANALDVMVQVNTSGEESKHGCEPADAVKLARHIVDNCPRLRFAGLMTIGMPDYTSRPECFETLVECRRHVCAELGLDESACELSMGMSGDFEQAIEMGSTNVRVGSTIFGAREYPNKA